MGRTRGGVGALVALLPAVVLVAGVDASVAAAEVTTGTASCTEGSVTWQVDYTFDTAFGGIVRVDALKKTQNGTTTDAGASTWQLRWDNAPNQWPPATPPASVVAFQEVEGPLSAVGGDANRRSIYTSPRLVTPDASCTLYLSPFVNLNGLSLVPKIGVLGDDLLQQLNESTFNQSYAQGYVEADLNAAGIRAEVEGHAGTGWTPTPGTTGLLRARSHLMDEFHGLIEHDIDGVVVGQGRKDALYIAAAAPADQPARRAEVWNRIVGSLGVDIQRRTACVAVVTMPQNPSSVDPDYAAAAQYLNDKLRQSAANSPTDGLELVDFGAQATTHKHNDAQPWFTAANEATFTAAGRDAYRAAITQAARRCADSVVLYGKAGTFTGGSIGDKVSLPTGQPLRTQAVPGWGFNPGKSAYWSTVTANGTVVVGNMSTVGPITATGDSMSITTFQPELNDYQNLRVKTDRGKESVFQDTTNPNDTPHGMDVSDVGLLGDGNAVAFIGGSPWKPGLDLVEDGMYPVFGIMTQKANGDWEVAEGPDGPDPDTLPDWRNSWSPRELRALSDPLLADRACPVDRTDRAGRPVKDCFLFTELAILPESGDIVISQYFGPSGHSGQIVVLDVTGPDAAGRYSVEIAAVETLPDIPDPHPKNAGYFLHVSAREVEADPTSRLGDERFGLTSDVYSCHGCPPPPPEPEPDPHHRAGHTSGVIEFSYDRGAADPIRPVSAPILPGDVRDDGRLAGTSPFHYDGDGNLWTSAHNGIGATKGLVVYAKTPTGRKPSNGGCPFDPAAPLGSYVTTQPGGGPPSWGVVCPPDYKVLMPTAVGSIWNIEEDSATGAIVPVSWPDGETYAVQRAGSGEAMSFTVSNLVYPKARSVKSSARIEAGVVAVGSGRIWLPVQQFRPTDVPLDRMALLDQWLYSVDLSRALGREPARLSAQKDGVTNLHAELTETTATINRPPPGTNADVNVDSRAPFRECTCTDPVSQWTAGVMLADENGAGVPADASAQYTLVVPKAGRYRVTYQALDKDVSGSAQIQLALNGANHVTTVANTTFAPVAGPTLDFTQPGTYTITLSSPSGRHGWQLDYMQFKRQ